MCLGVSWGLVNKLVIEWVCAYDRRHHVGIGVVSGAGLVLFIWVFTSGFGQYCFN